MARTISLTIRLLKDGLKTKEILKDEASLESTSLKSEFDFSGSVYWKPSSHKTPGWVKFLSNATASPLTKLFSANASALLLLKRSNRNFAISFGNSWQWLEEEAIERRFGLLVALNCIDDDQIKVVDAQQIDSLALSRRSQVSHSSEMSAFGLDVRRDLMKAIVGKPKSEDVGKNVMGADALRIRCAIDFKDIGKKCVQLLGISRKKDYQEKYPWVDNIEIVKSPEKRAELDKILVKRINEGDTAGIYLAPPRVRDISIDEEYRFHFDEENAQPRYDLEFEDLVAGISEDIPISIEYLKKRKIEVYASGSSAPVDQFSIYSGIVFETTHNNNLYCIIDGDWYKVRKAHVDAVNKQISLLLKSNLRLPTAKRNEKEGDYNKRASEELGALCLDRVLINYGGGRSKIELCDILTKAPCLIHVKKSSGSGVLSHLFNQGVVSGQFLLEEEFRSLCRDRTDGDYRNIFRTPFDPSKMMITYGIISARANKLPEELPFFSKQTLINAADLLRKFNYGVDLAPIKIA